MIPLGLLDQIYLVSMLVGGLFIGFNLLIGNLGEHSDGGAANVHTAITGDDFSTGSDLGAQHFSHGLDGTGGDASPAGDDLGDTDAANGGKLWTPSLARATMLGVAHGEPASMHTTPVIPSLTARLGGTLLSLLSPMSIAIFLTFFGGFGILFDQCLPWIGTFSLIPAVLLSMAISNSFKYLVRWLIVHGSVSTEAKVEDMVGQVGEVTVPITAGRVGEITYVMGSKRYQSSACSNSQELDLKKGSKVMIMQVKDHLVYVEPSNLAELDDASEYNRRS